MLSALSNNELGVPKQLQHLRHGFRMAECPRTHSDGFPAHFIRHTPNTEDQESLPVHMSGYIGWNDRTGLHDPSGRESGAVLQ